jgi:hypothetical protein
MLVDLFGLAARFMPTSFGRTVRTPAIHGSAQGRSLRENCLRECSMSNRLSSNSYVRTNLQPEYNLAFRGLIAIQ